MPRWRSMLHNSRSRIAEQQEQVVSAEVPPREEEGRGRTFMLIYMLILGLGILLFVALALVAHAVEYSGLDVTIARAIQGIHTPIYGWVLTQVSDFGFSPLDIITYVAIFAILATLGLRLEAVLAVASSLLAGAVGAGIRLLIGRMRPSPQLVHVAAPLSGYSFPSGHVIQYTTLFGFTFYVVLIVWRSSLPRNVVLIVLAILVILVGPSRVYLGEHWPSDVLGAYLLAGLWLAGTIELHLLLKRRLGKWGSRPLHRHKQHPPIVRQGSPAKPG